jgi:hypothetical protein
LSLTHRIGKNARILSVFLALIAGKARAVSVLGNLRIGAYTRSVEFDEPVNGELNNDEQVTSAQLKMDLTDFDSASDGFTVDMRDKVDSYGRLDTQNLALDTYNRFQVRELAFRRPYDYNKFYFSLGRFSLIEANVLDNDGAEFGYRWSRESRLSVFAGVAPKDVITPYYITPNTTSVDNTQAGLFYSYNKKSGLERSLYTNNAIAIGPTYSITDKKSHTYFYHMAIWNINPNNRVSSYLQQDFVPKSTLRRASVSHSFTDTNVRTNLSLLQTNTEDYLIRQDILDPLPPSSEQFIRFELRHRMLKSLSVDYSASFGKREIDGKTQSDYALGLILPRFILANGSFRTQYGVRNDYVSKGHYIRGGYDYWNQYFSASLTHTVMTQDYEDGFKNNRQITMVDGGFFLTDRVRGSLAYQIEKDDKLSASAFFLMLGYRFGSGAAAPIRTKPALFEEI